jgi:hypothetical protein
MWASVRIAATPEIAEPMVSSCISKPLQKYVTLGWQFRCDPDRPGNTGKYDLHHTAIAIY